MHSICLLTDSTALFPSATARTDPHLRHLPVQQASQRIHPPEPQQIQRIFNALEGSFQNILVLTVAPQLLPISATVWQAARSYSGPATITILETWQTGPGLGLLAQLGLQAIAAGAPLAEVEDRLRAAMPHIYTLICPIDRNNANPDLFTLFSMETVSLQPYKTARTRRQLLEDLLEFIEEFETPQQIIFFQGRPPVLRAQQLRQTTSIRFPEVSFIEMETNPTLSALFGPQTVGLTLMELPL
jgi:fatty acid-binding protein DegV